MFRSLRARLILSHVLPLLVIIPLAAVALIYLLETQVVLVNLSSELTGQAVLVAELTADYPQVFQSPQDGESLAKRLGPRVNGTLRLYSPDSRLVGSSDPKDSSKLGHTTNPTGLSKALGGEVSLNLDFARLGVGQVSAYVPIYQSTQGVLGVVGVTQTVAGAFDRFARLRYLILAVLAVALVLGVTVGWRLALNLEDPLSDVTRAVRDLAAGSDFVPIPERGPREIRDLMRSFNAMVHRLNTLEDARRQLLANLVHELGRPLGALHSAIDALQGGAVDDEELRGELLAGMQNEVAGLRRMVDDLAELHGQVLGVLEISRVPTDLGDWLPNMLAPWREMAVRRGLEWSTELAEELPEVMIDPARFDQAVGNLVSNAIKYTPPGGLVSVIARATDTEVLIDVRDTGPGMGQGLLDHVFVPLYRGNNHTHLQSGMGLGLTIAKELIAAHGGQIEVSSQLGTGSTFTVRLPRDRTSERQVSSPEPHV